MLSYFSLILALLSLTGIAQGVDETLEEKTKGFDVVEAVVRKITRSGIFPSDARFMRRIAFVETFDGEDSKTYRAGYFGGVWQVDEAYFNQTKNIAGFNYTDIEKSFGVKWSDVRWNDLLRPLHSGLAFRLFFQALNNNTIPGTIDAQGEFWVEHYRPEQTTVVYKDQVQRLESDGAVCEGMMDICIVLDGSASVGADDFLKSKQFVLALVRTFSMESTRVSFLTYGNLAYEVFNFQRNLNNEQMEYAILNAPYPNENTNTAAGLLMAVDFYKAIPSRNGIPQVVATFTDGLSNRGNTPEAVLAVRNANLTSFAIGITSSPEFSELLMIANLAPSRVFMVDNFDALAEFFYQMNAATCEVPQQPALGTNQTGSLNPLERRYFQYPLTNNGVSLDIQSQTELSGWYSYTDSNPNSAVYDGLITKGVTNIPMMTSFQDEEEPPMVYITLQCVSNSTAAEYVIMAQEGFQETVPTSPATTPTTTTDSEITQSTSESTTNSDSTTSPTTHNSDPTTSEELDTTKGSATSNIFSVAISTFTLALLCYI